MPSSSRPSTPSSHCATSIEGAQVDAGLDALAVEEVHEILGADVPGRAWRERAAADSTDGRVEHRRPGVEGGHRVGHAGVPRVVEVHADGRPEAHTLADEVPYLSGHRDADGVGEHDLVRAGLGEARGERQHAPGVDGALERAAERGAQGHGGPQAVLVCARHDPLSGRDRILRACACVTPVELLADSEGEVHLVERRVAQPLVAALVERQAGVA